MIRIGTRGSKLALWQAHYFKNQLDKNNLDSEIIIISTKGDREQNLSLDKLEGKGFFTKEIEDALLNQDIDVAVHSLKDLPTSMPPGLRIAGLSDRARSNDVLIIKSDSIDSNAVWNIKENAKVGTSSSRRKCWLNHYRPDLEFEDIRGNVPTRIGKLQNGDLDAIVLAAAGIERLEIEFPESLSVVHLDQREFVSAPGQGVIGYQIGEHNTDLHKQIYQASNKQLVDSVNIERKIMKLLDAGCHSPIGAYCTKDANGFYHVSAAFAKKWQDTPVIVHQSSSTVFELAESIVDEIKEKL